MANGSSTWPRTLVEVIVFIPMRLTFPAAAKLMLSFPVAAWDKTLKATGAVRGPQLGDRNGRLASQISPRLYLSDYRTARDAQKLQELGITHVISMLEFAPDLPEAIPKDRRLHIAVLDDPKADILTHLETTTAFIIAALNESITNKVLVCSCCVMSGYCQN